MSDEGQDVRTLLLMCLLALWLAAFGYSVVFFLTGEASGDGNAGGLDWASGFFGWQGVAGMFALACFGVGRSFSKSSGVRRISAIPLGMALTLFVAIIGFVGWSQWN